MKTCTGCGQEFPATLEHFYQAIPGRLMARCKACNNNAKRRYTNSRSRVRKRNYPMSPEYMEALRNLCLREKTKEWAEREEAMA